MTNLRRECCRALCLSLSASLLLGCGSDGTSPKSEPEENEVSLVTFNTGLLAAAPYVEERLRVLEQELPELSADVVCLQEIWEKANLDAVVAAARDSFPYSHYSIEVSGAEAKGCSQEETALLLGCLETECGDVGEDDLIDCAISYCADAFTQASLECQNCALEHQTEPVTEIARLCGSLTDEDVTYSHQNGLLLLSRFPLSKKDYQRFDSSFGERGVLTARLETELLPTVELFCTHLAATQSGITYSGEYGSWEGERRAQLDSLIETVEERVTSGQTAVVLGDLNCGPDEDAKGFSRLLESGFDSAYLGDEWGDCTFCADNRLIDDGEASVQIDHILFSGLPQGLSSSYERLFDEVLDLEVDGEGIETNLSDHYGLRVTVSE